jgi:type IV secretory pathway VirB6-like protein
MAEKHQRHMEMWMSQDTLFTLQALLMAIGFILAIQIIRHRTKALRPVENNSPNNSPNKHGFLKLGLLPLLLFVIVMTSFHLWMLMQPMVMRM